MLAERQGKGMDELMTNDLKIQKIAFLGDHLPRKCGIATFTTDLLAAVAEAHVKSQCFAVTVNDIEGGYEYPDVVRFEIEEQDLASYQRAADFLNIGNVDMVCVQHEFGIFGGLAGSHVLALLRELKMPVVTTLHTVLREPNFDQRRVMQELITRSTRLVVMTERGKQMLRDVYQAPAAKIDLIPHGIPDIPFVDPNYYKDQFGVEGRVVLLTFGLLSPNKGIENVLNALPADSGGVSTALFISFWAPRIRTSCASEAKRTGIAWKSWPRRIKWRKTSFSTIASSSSKN